MTRAAAVARAEAYFDTGAFKTDLARRIAIATESQNPDRAGELARYVAGEMKPALEALGFRCRIVTHPKARGPFLLGERIEDAALPTVFGYGHGDVVRGLEASWNPGLGPWQLVEVDGRYWGRGVADNKGQHTINIAAQAAVLATRGRLGFNAKWLIEMGEETGSPGLREVCAENRERLAADVLIASDGPRLAAERPTLSLGSRGAYPIDFEIKAREGGHHSGNWGGLLANPAIELAHALATITGPTGQVRIADWVPASIPESVRRVLADCELKSGPGDPAIDASWSHIRRKSLRLVHVRNSRDDGGKPGKPGQRGAAAGLGARAGALRSRDRSRSHPAGTAAPSRPSRLPDGEDRQRARRNFSRDARRSGTSLGPMGRRFAREDDGARARHHPQFRRLAAERHFHRGPRPADHLAAAFVPRVLAACSQRAPTGVDGARGVGAHGRPLLGPRRARDARKSARAELSLGLGALEPPNL